ncbi:hypothetical protein GOP47_0023057 [Adiantum capillus-veneris]|uniref:Uncharacterized protein n=1 Tax=Adiantum capillus-veneris TaxID=13818 RepID=A0A9D4U6R9_ADICA|nr:hypothetical protein GOP47_0023057 [Adiantum capillus-veneris]
MPLWTVRFVKWWSLYRLQDFATTSVASDLKRTIYLAWWYWALGAEVGEDVFLDTTDIRRGPWMGPYSFASLGLHIPSGQCRWLLLLGSKKVISCLGE